MKITKISQLKYITKDDLVSIGFTSSEKRRYQKAYDKYFPNPYFANLKGFIRKKKRKLVSILIYLFSKCNGNSKFDCTCVRHYAWAISNAGLLIVLHFFVTLRKFVFGFVYDNFVNLQLTVVLIKSWLFKFLENASIIIIYSIDL